MEVLKFNLSGTTAFFKKPDVNEYVYFTYGNIHKVALLGVLGSILGYKGYSQQRKEQYFPDFYKELKDIKISIIPCNEKGFINRKIQTFNNSAGYASNENGKNLIVREQWLENPSWDIYFIIDSEKTNKLVSNLLDNKSIYVPYLGKNEHFADISDISLYEDIIEEENCNKIDSLCPRKFIKIKENNDLFEQLELDYEDEKFKYEEFLPIGLNKETNMYQMEKFIYTNMNVLISNECKVYKVDNKNIVFI